MTRKITARGIVFHKGKILCARPKAYNNPNRDEPNDFWCLPGGKLDDCETILHCAEREMVEETGINPVLGNLLYIQQFGDGKTEFIEFFFHITNAHDYMSIDLSKTTHGQNEIEEIEFIDPKTTLVLPKFLSTEDIATQIEGNLPVKIFSDYDGV